MSIDSMSTVAGLASLGIMVLVAYLLAKMQAQINPLLVEIRQIHQLLRDRRDGELLLHEKMNSAVQRITRIEARMDVCPACNTGGQTQPEIG